MIQRTTWNRLARWLDARTRSGRARLRELDAATLWPAVLNAHAAIVTDALTVALLHANVCPAWRYPREWVGRAESPSIWFIRALVEQRAIIQAKEDNAAQAERAAEAAMRALKGRPSCE